MTDNANTPEQADAEPELVAKVAEELMASSDASGAQLLGEMAADGEEFMVSNGGQDWRVAWHPPHDPPQGTPHGAAAVCVVAERVVLVSDDGERWGLPGGRPEQGESWADTLRREVREEACAEVTHGRLLGFSRGWCVRGPQRGLVLVRSLWRAEVRLDAWEPRFEMTHRRLVPAGEILRHMTIDDGHGPIYRRMVAEAAILPRGPTVT